MHTAVTVQPLSSKQVDTYLDGLVAKGEEVEGVKQALRQNAALRALVTTPLFLTILILAYHDKPVGELLALMKAAPTDQSHLLFHNYVERMLQRKGTRIHASAQQTMHWLAWLACQLKARYQSEFYLEDLQPTWLATKRAKNMYAILFGLVVGLLVGLSSWLFLRVIFGLLGGLVVGLVYSLIIGLFFWRTVIGREIHPTDVFGWSYKKFWWSLISMVAVGVVFGIVLVKLNFVKSFDPLASLLVLLIIGLIMGLQEGLSGKQIPLHTYNRPNQGIQSSGLNALRVAFIVMLILCLGPIFTLRGELLTKLAGGLAFGFTVVPFVGLLYGGDAYLQHYILRFWLWRTHLFPWQAVSFLDDAADQLLLYKVGGGYIFRHRLLQDYFASLDVVSPHDPSFRAEAHSVLQNAPNSDPSM